MGCLFGLLRITVLISVLIIIVLMITVLMAPIPSGTP